MRGLASPHPILGAISWLAVVVAFVVDMVVCYSGFTGCDVRRAVFPLVDDWPLMLGIMAGMDQKDIFLRMRLTRRGLRQ